MNKAVRFVLIMGVAALAAGAASAAFAQDSQKNDTQATPKSFGYELKDNKPVPKGKRVTNADGSWTETVQRGACTTTKSMSASGEYKETRVCK